MPTNLIKNDTSLTDHESLLAGDYIEGIAKIADLLNLMTDEQEEKEMQRKLEEQVKARMKEEEREQKKKDESDKERWEKQEVDAIVLGIRNSTNTSLASLDIGLLRRFHVDVQNVLNEVMAHSKTGYSQGNSYKIDLMKFLMSLQGLSPQKRLGALSAFLTEFKLDELAPEAVESAVLEEFQEKVVDTMHDIVSEHVREENDLDGQDGLTEEGARVSADNFYNELEDFSENSQNSDNNKNNDLDNMSDVVEEVMDLQSRKALAKDLDSFRRNIESLKNRLAEAKKERKLVNINEMVGRDPDTIVEVTDFEPLDKGRSKGNNVIRGPG